MSADRLAEVSTDARTPARIDEENKAIVDGPAAVQQRTGLWIVDDAPIPVNIPRSGSATISPIGVTRF